MLDNFETQKNTKAFSYTAIICGVLLAIAILYTFPIQIPPAIIAQDLIEINLGNEKEGMGDVQPLVKGDPAPDNQSVSSHEKAVKVKEEPTKDLQPDENNDKDAAPLNKATKPVKEAKIEDKPITNPTKKVNPSPILNSNPTPLKPKLPLYKGGNGNGGNGATEDNGYRNQGYKPGNGDAGSPTGKPDSYGNSPGGRPGGTLRVSKGDRTIVNNYIFMGDLPKATINAIIRVNSEGRGTFVSFDKGSTSTESSYANAIRSYLPNIQFSKSDHESIVTVPFNFRVQ
jgi:hypothetical protein